MMYHKDWRENRPTSNKEYDGLVEILKDYIIFKDLCFNISCLVFGDDWKKHFKGKKGMDYLICQETRPLSWECKNNFESFQAANDFFLNYISNSNNQTTLIQVPKYLPHLLKSKLVAYKLQPNVVIKE